MAPGSFASNLARRSTTGLRRPVLLGHAAFCSALLSFTTVIPLSLRAHNKHTSLQAGARGRRVRPARTPARPMRPRLGAVVLHTLDQIYYYYDLNIEVVHFALLS